MGLFACRALQAATTAALALGLLGGASPAKSKKTDEKLTKLYDAVSARTTRALKRSAANARLPINDDVDVLLTPEVDVAFATVMGFEELDLDNGGAAGVDIGVLFLSGHRLVPDGFYVLQFVIDPARAGKSFARLISSDGEAFQLPLSIRATVDPGQDPRKMLSSESGRDLLLSLNLGAKRYEASLDSDLDLRPAFLPVAQVGESFITTFMTANGFPPDSFMSNDPLPPGLSLTGASLTGVPSTVGDFTFTIEASDSAGNHGMRNYTLSVLPAGLLILTDALPDAVVNASYGAQVLALGGVKPYLWRVDGDVPGLTFTGSGFFNGRPTVAGMFIVTVTVQDQAGSETSADLSLTVNPTGLVSVTPDLLPNGLLGAPYDVPILPSGGTPPYVCELVDGQLPPGLTLSGCATSIGGVARLPGVFGFTVQIRDSSNPPETHVISRHIRIVAEPEKSGSK